MAIVIGIVVARRLLRFRLCRRHILLEKNTLLLLSLVLLLLFNRTSSSHMPFSPFLHHLDFNSSSKVSSPTHTHTLVCPNECTNFLVKLKGFQPMFFEASDQICLVYGYCRAASWKCLYFGWKPHTIPMQNWHIH